MCCFLRRKLQQCAEYFFIECYVVSAVEHAANARQCCAISESSCEERFEKSGSEYQGHSLASIGAWKSVLGDNIKICPTVKNYCERRGAVFAAVLALLPSLIRGPPSCPCHINSHSTLTSSANTLSLGANTLPLSANTLSLSATEILFNFPHLHSPH